MPENFDPDAELIKIWGHITGPFGVTAALFMLDTGATRTLIGNKTLRAAGYDPESGDQGFVITGSGSEKITYVGIESIICLERVPKPS